MINKLEDSRNEFKIKLTNVQEGIMNLILDRPNITQKEMAILLNVTERTIRNHIKILLENNYIKRVGVKKKGMWIINDENRRNHGTS